MVFEDLQWADSGLLAFIDHLVEWSRGVPIYVLALARPELLETRPDWGAGTRNFTSLALEPLPTAVMLELLAGLVPGPARGCRRAHRGSGRWRAPLRRRDRAHAGGRGRASRPRTGSIDRSGTWRTWRSRRRSSRSSRRGSTRSTRPTDPWSWRPPCSASRSRSTGLAAVAALDPAEVERRLLTLARRELVVRDTNPRSTERGQFAFVQSLVREVAYGMLARRDRKSRHLAAARYFETLVRPGARGRARHPLPRCLPERDRGTRGGRARGAGADRPPGGRRAGGRPGRPGTGAGLLPGRARGDDRGGGSRRPARARRPGGLCGGLPRGGRAAPGRGDRASSGGRRPQRRGPGDGPAGRRDVRTLPARRRPRPHRAGRRGVLGPRR